MTELAEKVMDEYGDELDRKTIGIDVGIREIIAMIEDVKSDSSTTSTEGDS